jgi:hypothetical protein
MTRELSILVDPSLSVRRFFVVPIKSIYLNQGIA